MIRKNMSIASEEKSISAGEVFIPLRKILCAVIFECLNLLLSLCFLWGGVAIVTWLLLTFDLS